MRYSYEVSAAALACALFVSAIAYAAHRWRTRPAARTGRFCPGRRAPILSYLNPLRWYIHRGCNYDLAGLRATENGSTICPECGRTLASLTHARAHPGGVRWSGLALTCIALFWAAAFIPAIRTGSWATHAPDWLIVAHRFVLGKHGFSCLNSQADDRIHSNTLSPRAIGWTIASYIDDLRDDNIRYNAENAISILCKVGIPATPKLEAALHARDYQQRQLAAHVLRDIHEQCKGVGYSPSDALLRITAEGLNSDTIPYEPSRIGEGSYHHYTGIANAREGIEFFSAIGPRAAPYLLIAMQRGDEQAKLLAAGVAARNNFHDLLPIAAPILITHLKDNNTYGDARFSTSALLGFGPDVLPYLDQAAASSDSQSRKTAAMIALDLITSETECTSIRRRLQCVSSEFADPARLELTDQWVQIPAN